MSVKVESLETEGVVRRGGVDGINDNGSESPLGKTNRT